MPSSLFDMKRLGRAETGVGVSVVLFSEGLEPLFEGERLVTMA